MSQPSAAPRTCILSTSSVAHLHLSESRLSLILQSNQVASPAAYVCTTAVLSDVACSATWMTQMGWSFRSTCRHQLALVHLHTQFGSSLTHRDDIVLPESGHR
ncbi:hypothetical protein ABBQ38_010785 [Trebouxia sp. C0009 RCD-2024]